MNDRSSDYPSDELSDKTVGNLRNLASEMGLIGYSRLRKQDLINYIRRHLRVAARSKDPLSAAPDRVESASEPEAVVSAEEEAPAPEHHPGTMRDPDWYPPELPETYGKDRLTLMVRDPNWLFCYWEVSDSLLERARQGLEDPHWKVLRVHLLGSEGEVIDGWEYDLTEEARSWYVNTGRPGASFHAELGLKDSAGRYHFIVDSQSIAAPQETPSDRWDEEWVGLSREAWEKLERAARPFPGSLVGIDTIKRELKTVTAHRLSSESLPSTKLKRVPST